MRFPRKYNKEDEKKAYDLRQSGKTHKEISEIMNIPRGSVPNLIKRGKNLIQDNVLTIEKKPEDKGKGDEEFTNSTAFISDNLNNVSISEAPEKDEANDLIKMFVNSTEDDNTPPVDVDKNFSNSTDVTGGDKIQLIGLNDFIIATMNDRYKKAGLDVLNEQEKQFIKSSWAEVEAKRLNINSEYADIINFGASLFLPTGTRLIKKKGLFWLKSKKKSPPKMPEPEKKQEVKPNEYDQAIKEKMKEWERDAQ